MAEDIAITFETLYDILRREKNREELQSLNLSFFEDVVDYLKEKQNSSSGNEDNLFAGDSGLKSQQQLDNIKRIIRDIYDIREKKIIALARDVSRTGTNLIDMKTLLEEEKDLYTNLLSLFDRFRKNILHKVLVSQMPTLEEEEPKTLKREAKSTTQGYKLLRFVEPVQQFVGPELESVGPFKKEDVASLPDKVAEVLMAKGSVEVIEEQ